jgi:hypothetical protein
MYWDQITIIGLLLLGFSIDSAFGLSTCIGLRVYMCVHFWKLLHIALKSSVTVYSLLMYWDQVTIIGLPILDFSIDSALGLSTCIGLREYVCSFLETSTHSTEIFCHSIFSTNILRSNHPNWPPTLDLQYCSSISSAKLIRTATPNTTQWLVLMLSWFVYKWLIVWLLSLSVLKLIIVHFKILISKAKTMTNFMDNVSYLTVETNRIVNLQTIISYFECSVCLNLMIDPVQVSSYFVKKKFNYFN